MSKEVKSHSRIWILLIDIVIIIGAALLFFIVSVWFNVISVYFRASPDDTMITLERSIRFAIFWTAFVALIVGIAVAVDLAFDLSTKTGHSLDHILLTNRGFDST